MNSPVEERYKDGTYLSSTGGSWHDEDGPFKAASLGRILANEKSTLEILRRGRSPLRLVDVGCGSGAALNAATNILRKQGFEVDAKGVDPSPDANALMRKLYPSLSVVQGYAADAPDADLLMLFDVIEHVTDPIALLRQTAERARFLALHIPLENTLYDRAMGKWQEHTDTVGHIHFFHRWSALSLLQQAGLTVRAWEYTRHVRENQNLNFNGQVMLQIRNVGMRISKNVSAHVFGGCEMIVLCEGRLALKP